MAEDEVATGGLHCGKGRSKGRRSFKLSVRDTRNYFHFSTDVAEFGEFDSKDLERD